MPKYTREDKTVYYGADKEKPEGEYKTPPVNDTEIRNVKVGILNHNFATYSGPQRNRPSDKLSKKTGNSIYRRSLFARSRAYGEFRWELLTLRVVSERADGTLYPLDGNSSNHWLERLFGPDFEVPCRVLKDRSLREEKEVFLKLQEVKRVTATEKYVVDTEYDETSLSFAIKDVVEASGFEIAQRPKDACALGRTTAETVVKRFGTTGRTHGLNALGKTLTTLTGLFPEDDWKRTNRALVVALAVILHDEDEFPDVTVQDVLDYMRDAGADALVNGAMGTWAENIVLQRIHDAVG